MAFSQGFLKEMLGVRVTGYMINLWTSFCLVSGDVTGRWLGNLNHLPSGSSQSGIHIPLQLAGVVFLGVGLWAWSEKGVLSDLTKVTRMHGIDPVVLVLMVGVVMFTLGFAGCVGALRENICLLNFFCSAIVLIFFLELAVAVLAFLFQDWVRDRFREFFESNIRSYRDDIDLQNLIDSLQKANQCCGAYGPEDWDLNVYFNCSGASYSREKCGVPFSCCVPDPAQKVVNTQCGYDVRTQLKSKWDESIFTKGCIQALEGWLPRNIYIVAGVFIAISLLQWLTDLKGRPRDRSIWKKKEKNLLAKQEKISLPT
ncbi:tetraspanin-14 isoform X2 [Lagenorhynchus albirostris]|uniref:tetraspanin-14 isoform X2 n=1 Tax=Lagenorhynchus albirostris TaxID=27610 RepID=UPI0028EFDC71|nr:tetraspanin-14 isoform X2 [Lagenorhynchus albirostris]